MATVRVVVPNVGCCCACATASAAATAQPLIKSRTVIENSIAGAFHCTARRSFRLFCPGVAAVADNARAMAEVPAALLIRKRHARKGYVRSATTKQALVIILAAALSQAVALSQSPLPQ